MTSLTRRIYVLLISVFGLITVPCPAVAERFSLQECLALALEHNLDLQIARHDPRIAEYQLSMAYSIYEPSLSASHSQSFSASPGGIDEEQRFFAGTETDQDSYQASLFGQAPLTGLSYDFSANLSETSGEGPAGPFGHAGGSVSVNLRQPLLRNSWTDGGRINIKLSKRDLKISEEQLRWRTMAVVTQVELAYYDLILANENLKVQQSSLELAEQLLLGHQRRVEVGLLPALDEKQAEAQVASRQANLQAAQQSVTVQEYQLKELMSEDFALWADVEIVPDVELTAVPQSLDKQESWRRALTMRPDLLQARLELEKQGIVLKYRYNQLFPQLDVVGSYGYRGSDPGSSGVFDDIREENSPFYRVGAVLSIPLGNTSARKSYRIAQARESQSVLGLKQLEQSIMVAVGIAVEHAKTAFRRVETTRQAQGFARMALEAEQKKLESGKSTTFIVLQLQRDLTSAQLAELQALIDYTRALVQLARQEGATLQRHDIEMEIR